MKIAVLGSGMVGQTIGSKLVELGHTVRMGSRSATNDKAEGWAKQTGAKASHGTFEDAASFGEIIFNCTNGGATLDALRAAGVKNLSGKVLIDVSNPLDFSKGFPPTLSVCNTDSVGERIQEAFPAARVVKTLNTVGAPVMVAPGAVAGGEHTMFVAGNDQEAKNLVTDTFLRGGFGWKHVMDLGDIKSARGMEMYLPLWLSLMQVGGSPLFNIAVLT